MNHRTYRRSFLVAVAVFAVLGATTAPAGARGRLRIAERLRGFMDREVLVGTALTPPIRLSQESLETEVWVFSTVLGKSVSRVRFGASDLAKVSETIKTGSTIAVYQADVLVIDGEAVMVASRWKSTVDSNPLRAEFLIRYRAQILSYALRARPLELHHIYASDLGELRQLQDDIEQVRITLDAVTRREPTAITATGMDHQP